MSGFRRLLLWEIETTWRFPVPEIILGAATFFLLSGFFPIIDELIKFQILSTSLERSLLVQIAAASVVFSISFGRTRGKGELKMLLSYPIKRGTLFFAKFFTNYLIILGIFAVGLGIKTLLVFQTSIVSTEFLLLMAFLALELLLLSSVSTAIALFIGETGSLLMSFFLLFTLQQVADQLEAPLKYIGISEAYHILEEAGRVLLELHKLEWMEMDSLLTAIGFPITTSLICLTVSIIYITRHLELD